MALPIATIGLSLAATGLKIYGGEGTLVEFLRHPIELLAGHRLATDFELRVEKFRTWAGQTGRLANDDLDRAVAQSVILADLFCLRDSLPLGLSGVGPQRLQERFRSLLRVEPVEGVLSKGHRSTIQRAITTCEKRLEEISLDSFQQMDIDPARLVIEAHERDWGAALARSALAELEREHPALSEQVRSIFDERWFAYLCLAFHEEIKKKSQVRRIFMAMQVATGSLKVEDGIRDLRSVIQEEEDQSRNESRRQHEEALDWLRKIMALLEALASSKSAVAESTEYSCEDKSIHTRPPDKTRLPKLVGRSEQEGLLVGTFENSERNIKSRGNFILIAGEEGLGKTFLVESFVAYLRERSYDFELARARCATMWKRSEGYLPWVRALKSLRDTNSGLLEGYESWQKVVRLHQKASYQAVDVGGEHDTSRAALKEELRSILVDITASRPLLLFFDDLHGADDSSLDLLYDLVREPVPAFIIGTYRPSAVLPGSLLEIISSGAKSGDFGFRIDLVPLKKEDVAEYIFGEKQLSSELSDLVFSWSQGNPLLVTGLLNFLKRELFIRVNNGTWHLAFSREEVRGQLPDSREGLISRMFEQLGTEEQRILQLCSLRGQHFETAPVSTAYGEFTGSPDAIELLSNVLMRSDFWVERDDGRRKVLDRTTRYKFAHSSYQDWICRSINPRVLRHQLNSHLAEALLLHYGQHNTAVFSEVAQLFDAAGEFSKAIRYYLLATEREAQVSARQEAGKLAKMGLACLVKLQMTNTDFDYNYNYGNYEIKLLNLRNRSIMISQGYAGTEDTEALPGMFKRAIALSGEREDVQSLYDTKYGLWNYYLVRAEYSEAKNICDELLELSGHPLLGLDFARMAQYTVGLTLLQLGALASAEDHLGIACRESEAQKRRTAIVFAFRDDRISTKVHHARAQWFLGYVDLAAQTAAEALAMAEEFGDQEAIILAHFWAGDLSALTRAWKVAKSHLTLVIDNAHKYEFRQEIVWAGIWGARLAVEEGGNIDFAIAQLEHLLAQCQRVGCKIGETKIVAILAEIMARSGDSAVKQKAIAHIAKTLAEIKEERYYVSELLRVQGELLSAEGREVEAENSLLAAYTDAEGKKARFLALRSALSLYGVLQRQGRQSEIRRQLENLTMWFLKEQQGLDTPEFKDATRLLESLRRMDRMAEGSAGDEGQVA